MTYLFIRICLRCGKKFGCDGECGDLRREEDEKACLCLKCTLREWGSLEKYKDQLKRSDGLRCFCDARFPKKEPFVFR